MTRQLPSPPGGFYGLRNQVARQCGRGFVPNFEHLPPVWELRVGEFRIFYDVDSEAQVVYVRAVRRKAQDQTTEDIA